MTDLSGQTTSSDDEPVFGALARAEALAAGDPDWMTVTRWHRASGRTPALPLIGTARVVSKKEARRG